MSKIFLSTYVIPITPKKASEKNVANQDLKIQTLFPSVTKLFFALQIKIRSLTSIPHFKLKLTKLMFQIINVSYLKKDYFRHIK